MRLGRDGQRGVAAEAVTPKRQTIGIDRGDLGRGIDRCQHLFGQAGGRLMRGPVPWHAGHEHGVSSGREDVGVDLRVGGAWRVGLWRSRVDRAWIGDHDQRQSVRRSTLGRQVEPSRKGLSLGTDEGHGADLREADVGIAGIELYQPALCACRLQHNAGDAMGVADARDDSPVSDREGKGAGRQSAVGRRAIAGNAGDGGPIAHPGPVRALRLISQSVTAARGDGDHRPLEGSADLPGATLWIDGPDPVGIGEQKAAARGGQQCRWWGGQPPGQHDRAIAHDPSPVASSVAPSVSDLAVDNGVAAEPGRPHHRRALKAVEDGRPSPGNGEPCAGAGGRPHNTQVP